MMESDSVMRILIFCPRPCQLDPSPACFLLVLQHPSMSHVLDAKLFVATPSPFLPHLHASLLLLSHDIFFFTTEAKM